MSRALLPPVLLALVLALGVPDPGLAAGHTVAIPSWARDFLAQWYVAYNTGDAARVASLFTPDAKLGPDRGRAAIEASLRKGFATSSYRCSGRYDSFRVLGAMAVASGVDSCVETPKPAGTPVVTAERWLLVFERQPDGRWLISRETWEDVRR